MKFHLVTAKINADADGPHEFSEFVASQADAANVPYEEHPKTAYCGFILAEG